MASLGMNDRFAASGASHPGELNKRFVDALGRGDVPAVLRLFEPEAIAAFIPGSPPVQGLAAIEYGLRWLLSLKRAIRPVVESCTRKGPLAASSLRLDVSDGEDPFEGVHVELHGTVSALSRQQPDGNWKYLLNVAFRSSP
jgi:ketosteroid isomerase-like protein